MRDLNLYGISGLHQYVDAENFGLILDSVNAKYNGALWRRFASWGNPTDDREWKQGIKKTPILVRASVLGTHSEKPQRSTIGWEFYGGTLPQIGHGFNITQDDMIELRKSAKLSNVTFGEALTDSFILNSGAMIGGVHNELTYMVTQAMSTGEIHGTSCLSRSIIPRHGTLVLTTGRCRRSCLTRLSPIPVFLTRLRPASMETTS